MREETESREGEEKVTEENIEEKWHETESEEDKELDGNGSDEED